jgi:hypothetical protein
MDYKIRKRGGDIIIFDKSAHKGFDKEKFLTVKPLEKILEINKILDEGYEVVLDNDLNIKDKLSKTFYGIKVTDIKKYQISQMLKEYLETRVNEKTIIDYIDYIDVRDILADRGFIVTDSNKEEKYLEILETEDDELIDLLEEFLILKDDLTEIKTARRTYKKLMEKLKSTPENDIETLEEIKKSIPR